MHVNLRNLTMAWLLMIFLLVPALTRAETTVQAWVQRYNGPGNAADIATAVAVDSSNNVIVTGYSDGGGGNYDFATIKYSGTGVPLWTNRYSGSLPYGTDSASSVAVDGNDDVVATGSSYNGANADYATVKYSSAGVPLWTNLYSGPGNRNDQATAVAVDGNNSVIVTGYSVTSAGYTNYATIKYSSAGVPLWTNRYAGPANWDAYACAVAVDGNNNIIVTGYSYDTGSSSDYATIKYSSEGVPLWTNRYNGPGNGSDYATAVAVDGGNNVIVTGWSPSSGGDYHYATVKYSSEGVPLWTNRYIGSANSLDRAFAVAVDSSNSVVVTGKSMSKVNDYDYATVKYSSEGVPLWTNRYVGSRAFGTDSACSVAVDSNNNIIVTGWSGNFATLVDAVYATVKYSSAGVPVWTNRYSAPASGTNQPCAMVLDRTGNVIVAGYSQGTGSGSDFTTIKYLCVPSPVLTGRQLTNGTFQLLVEDVLLSGTLVIEASTNLGGWAPVFTNTTPTNALFYTDPDADNWPVRFYRAFQFP